MPLLLIVYKALTTLAMTIHGPTTPNVFELEVFGSLVSTKKIALGFLIVEISLFKVHCSANKSFQSFYLVGRT
jgi:hypothetical protein